MTKAYQSANQITNEANESILHSGRLACQSNPHHAVSLQVGVDGFGGGESLYFLSYIILHMPMSKKELVLEYGRIVNRIDEAVSNWNATLIKYHEHSYNGQPLIDISIVESEIVDVLGYVKRMIQKMKDDACETE